jgi:hypothetical protein
MEAKALRSKATTQHDRVVMRDYTLYEIYLSLFCSVVIFNLERGHEIITNPEMSGFSARRCEILISDFLTLEGTTRTNAMIGKRKIPAK